MRSSVQLRGGLGGLRARPPPRLAPRSTPGTVAALRTGIVGLPNVGKSTLFNALVENATAQAANFPFCTIEPNVGLVSVPDDRMLVLKDLASAAKVVPAVVEFVDIAGLVKGASEGEGLGNKFLSNIRETDAIVQVVRCFEDDEVVHVSGRVDPVEDMGVINFELALADLAQIERRVERLGKGRAKSKDEKARDAEEMVVLDKLKAALEEGEAARSVELTEDEFELVKPLYLLTIKPMIYAANVADSDLGDQGANNSHVQAVREAAEKEGASVIIVSAQVESELVGLEPEERAEFLEELGVKTSGLQLLARAAYGQLGLQTYFTAGEKEVRAWTIRKGMTAPQAAGVIHTDFEKQFIRAETMAYDDYVDAQGFAGGKENGKLRLEGKDYVVQEGDVMVFRTGA